MQNEQKGIIPIFIDNKNEETKRNFSLHGKS